MNILSDLAEVIQSLEPKQLSTEELVANLTQETWVNGLIKAWQSDRRITSALLYASVGEGSDRRLTSNEWEQLHMKACTLMPKLDAYTKLTQRVAPWLARHSKHASNALFDGDVERAKRWICSGKDKSDFGRMSARKMITEEDKLDMYPNMLHLNNLRERDNRTNWKVCK